MLFEIIYACTWTLGTNVHFNILYTYFSILVYFMVPNSLVLQIIYRINFRFSALVEDRI